MLYFLHNNKVFEATLAKMQVSLTCSQNVAKTIQNVRNVRKMLENVRKPKEMLEC